MQRWPLSRCDETRTFCWCILLVHLRMQFKTSLNHAHVHTMRAQAKENSPGMKPGLSVDLVYQDEATSDSLHNRPYIHVGVAMPTVVHAAGESVHAWQGRSLWILAIPCQCCAMCYLYGTPHTPVCSHACPPDTSEWTGPRTLAVDQSESYVGWMIVRLFTLVLRCLAP
jgi:hypothetical protein